jgi:hypothetical protein
VTAVVVAFLVAALLGSDALVGLARRQEFGWQRSVALTVAESVDRMADLFSLDRPTRTARHLLGKDHRTYDVDALIDQAASGDGAAPAGRGATQQGAGQAPAPPTSTVTAAPRVPSAADPLRIYVGGDSMGRELGNGLAQAAPTALSRVENDYRVSTGLSRPDFFDWPGRLAQLIVERRPDVFVLIFGTNDDQNMETDAGVLEAGSAPWLAEYRARVARVMDLVRQPGTTTVWVGMPTMRSGSFDASMATLDDIYRDEAARRPWITYVDSRSLFASPTGGYADFQTGTDGGDVSMRQEDGIHWSMAGAAKIGGAAWQAIARQWSLPTAG